MSIGEDFEKLVKIIEVLRSDNGCPWDKEQTPETVKRYLVEEAYEAITEVENGNNEGVMEEIGDLIFMSLFMAYLYQQQGDFSISDVLQKAASKMIYRHPHVFGNKKVNSPQEVKKNWEILKNKEKKKKAGSLDVPRSLPALMRAHRLAGRTRDLCCQGKDIRSLISFLSQSLQEFEKNASSTEHDSDVKARIGEYFLALVCLARMLGVNSEEALHETIQNKLRLAMQENKA